MDLNIQGVRFSYGSKDVLNGLTFDLDSGNMVGILGQNGCGKTTLLNCINTVLRPTEGCIMIDDEGGLGDIDVQDVGSRELARHMATVAQNSGTSFPFTVLDVVRMGRYAHTGSSTREDTEAVYRALEKVGMLDYVDRSINELSGGEQRRAMIARALVQEPDVLLLDEPTLHLDINNQFDLMDLVRDLVDERGILAVVVTHDLVLAARYCDRIIMMQKGRIVDIGECADVITPKNIHDVFHVDAEVTYSEVIHGLNVFIHGKSRDRGGPLRNGLSGNRRTEACHHGTVFNRTQDKNSGVHLRLVYDEAQTGHVRRGHRFVPLHQSEPQIGHFPEGDTRCHGVLGSRTHPSNGRIAPARTRFGGQRAGRKDGALLRP